MNIEPVAWIGKNELQFGFTETMVTNEKESWDDIPLYTHPVKTLTDEEIYEVLWKHFPISDKEANANFIAVVTHCIRVALRKAQET